MIKANHKKIARSIFTPYVDRLLKKNFSALYTVNKVPKIPDDHSLIITPNHISWWDGFFIDKIHRLCIPKKLHLMMLEDQLTRFWFFRFVGAFSINPGAGTGVVETVKYVRSLISDYNNSVIVYPQGEIEPYEKRPLKLKEGIRIFVGKGESRSKILPIGFKIQYYDKKFPAVIVRFGSLLDVANVVNDFDIFKTAFMQNLDKLSEAAYRRDFASEILNDNEYI